MLFPKGEALVAQIECRAPEAEKCFPPDAFSA